MKKIADFIVNKRSAVLAVMLVLAVACGAATLFVGVNSDMTKYLPDDSSMKKGLDIMESEFPQVEDNYTVRVMFDNLGDEQRSEIKTALEEIEYVNSVDYEAKSDTYNKENHTLYVVNTKYDYGTKEESAIEKSLKKLRKDDFSDYEMSFQNDDIGMEEIPLWILISAVVILMTILFVMCNSWIEPFLFLVSIGVSVVLNTGTNIFMGEISEITFSIAAILQLVLSMDCSIILLNRYRQELPLAKSKFDAMKNAVAHAFSSIAGSSATTVVGLLALVFMSFKIGADFGIVLAKGVFLSMLCTFTVLPGLILISDKLIRKTAKKSLHIKTGALAAFSYKFRYVITAVFVLLFVGAFLLKGNTDIVYTLDKNDKIAETFPPSNTVVIIYDNADDGTVTELAETLALENAEKIESVSSYSLTLGKEYTGAELMVALKGFAGGGDMDIDASLLGNIFLGYFANSEDGGDTTVTMGDFLDYIANEVAENPDYADLFDDSVKAALQDAKSKLAEGAAQLRGEKYSRLILSTKYPVESDETMDFFENLTAQCDANLTGDYYLIGNSAMNFEMKNSFNGEMNFITMLTAIAIFIVILLTFRSFSVPAVLVLVIQCGVFLTVSIIGIQGYSIFYLALLIVQCILMGATIDYGILFTSYYREKRKSAGIKEALEGAYQGAIHTILTSGLIMILITGILGYCFSNPTIGQICQTISKGAMCATVLILFVLPGILAALDGLVRGRGSVSTIMFYKKMVHDKISGK